MESLWNRITKFEEFETLEDDIQVDTAVIGAGITGIITAYLLKEKGVETVVLEADRVASGQTSGTTAKITSQHNLIYQKLIRIYGIEMARQYAWWNEWAIRQYERIIEEKEIECDFIKCSAYLYSQHEDFRLKEEAEAAKALGIDAVYGSICELPFPVKGVAEFRNQARISPLKFLKEIVGELKIYENTRVSRVERIREGETRLYTRYGTVTAKHVVFACHFPFVNIPGYYFAQMYQSRSYVLALKHADQFQGYYLGVDEDGCSFRNVGDLLLIGGGKHRTGENREGGKYRILLERAKEWWPECKEVARWSAQDCMTLDGIPYIGRFEQKAQDWFVATGFGKWGMTSAMVSAGLLSDLITGKEKTGGEIYSPQRRISVEAVKEFAKNSIITAKNLGKEIISIQKATEPEIKESPIELRLRCPHLGCRLAWNPDERTWECPCHGSEFQEEGYLVNGPAQKGMG